jgi:hypothetical protein
LNAYESALLIRCVSNTHEDEVPADATKTTNRPPIIG